MDPVKPLNLRGFMIYKSLLSPAEQGVILDDIRGVIKQAPLFSPVTAWGKPMSVGMSSAGRYGWYSDRSGYRYEGTHPNGMPWPAIPQSVMRIWSAVTECARTPDCCLINHYTEKARMGLHQDNDEQDFGFPVVSVSLGDEGLFRIGGTDRKDKTESIWLSSGDVCVMGGAARLAYHGIDRIRFGSSALLKNNGRINLTLRVVD
nr:alpha-ketoglutarate-dependent dioxygenase AlkB [Amylibacter sp.]